MPIRHATTIAFDFDFLSQENDEAILKRFDVVRRVNPTLVPSDFRADACRIVRDPDAITLHFYQRDTPEEAGTETFRFSFQPVD